MKRILTTLILLIQVVLLFAQTTYFPNNPSSWVDSGHCKARLYSVEIQSERTLVTIELVPTRNRSRLNYQTSNNTYIVVDGEKYPFLGGLSNGEYHACPPDSWGWSNVKAGESYRYVLAFAGHIPSGMTTFSLEDPGAYSGFSGYKFRNYTLNNPRKDYTNLTSEYLIKQSIDKENDPICGIYEEVSGDITYKLACIKEYGSYKLIYISSKNRKSWWKTGDYKAKLRETASKGIFKADWFMLDKSIEDAYITFDGTTMDVVVTNVEDPKSVYLKTYPTASQESGHASGGKWAGTGFALKDGYIVTNHHVIDGAKTISVYGVNGNSSRSYTATVAASDKNNDLALLKISDYSFNGFATIPYAVRSGMAEVGEDVFVLGYPLTQVMGNEVKLTNGIISSRSGYQGDISTYQISAPAQPGNSGGPLFDKSGNIIGIVNAGIPGAENVGYAIKVSYLRNLIENVTSSSILPSDNQISSYTLPQKVAKVRDFVFFIMCE